MCRDLPWPFGVAQHRADGRQPGCRNTRLVRKSSIREMRCTTILFADVCWRLLPVGSSRIEVASPNHAVPRTGRYTRGWKRGVLMWKVEVSPKIVALFGGWMAPKWARMVTAPVCNQGGHRVHRQSGWARRPLATEATIVSTGGRGVASGTMPFLAAGLGCRPDRLLMAWDECHGAVGRREDCVTVTHLSAGEGRACPHC